MPTLGPWKLRQPEFLFIVPATLLLFLISPLLAPGSVSLSTSLSVFSFASVLAVAAIGQTLVIQQGGLDLTVPGIISLAAVLVTKYPDGENARLLPWTVVALGAGFLSGFVNGIAITRFRITPLVATLAVNALLNGAVLYITKGTSTHQAPSWLADFAVGRVGGIPNLAITAFIAVVIVEVGIRATKFGRRFVAIGANAHAARAAGHRVALYQVATYALAGALYATAGVLLAGYLGIPSSANWQYLSLAHDRRCRLGWHVIARRGWKRGGDGRRRRVPKSTSADDDRHGGQNLDSVHHSGGDHCSRYGVATYTMAVDPIRTSKWAAPG